MLYLTEKVYFLALYAACSLWFSRCLNHILLVQILVLHPSFYSWRRNPSRGCPHRKPLRETFARLADLFGIGWWFEWPGGYHPLNSTWPWADVQPSLLVLWGVCWMFATPIDMPRSISQPPYYTTRNPAHCGPRIPQSNSYCCVQARPFSSNYSGKQLFLYHHVISFPSDPKSRTLHTG